MATRDDLGTFRAGRYVVPTMQLFRLSTLFVLLVIPSAASADRILNLRGAPLDPLLMLGGHQELIVGRAGDDSVFFTSDPPGRETTEVVFLVGTTEISTTIHGSLSTITEGCQVGGIRPADALVSTVAVFLSLVWSRRRSRMR